LPEPQHTIRPHAQEKKDVILPLFGDTATAQPSSGGGGRAAGRPQSGIVLVSGATGGVGKRVVQVSGTAVNAC